MLSPGRKTALGWARRRNAVVGVSPIGDCLERSADLGEGVAARDPRVALAFGDPVHVVDETTGGVVAFSASMPRDDRDRVQGVGVEAALVPTILEVVAGLVDRETTAASAATSVNRSNAESSSARSPIGMSVIVPMES